MKTNSEGTQAHSMRAVRNSKTATQALVCWDEGGQPRQRLGHTTPSHMEKSTGKTPSLGAKLLGLWVETLMEVILKRRETCK